MGNSILAGTLAFNPILPPLALAQEKPSSPAAQPSPFCFAAPHLGGSVACDLASATIAEAQYSEE